MSDKTDHRPPQPAEGEKATLVEFLNYLRQAMVSNVEGLLGLVKHVSFVERFYFLGEDVSDWSATFRPTPDDTIQGVLSSYRDAVSRANEIVDACEDLGQPAPRSARPKSARSIRWILVHMIEETGRHAGHADILREQIDGATGR